MPVHFTKTKPFTREEMDAAFTNVQNSTNWKMPINAIVQGKDLDVTVDAIMYFAGSITNVKHIKGTGKYHITAPGYYQSVGS